MLTILARTELRSDKLSKGCEYQAPMNIIERENTACFVFKSFHCSVSLHLAKDRVHRVVVLDGELRLDCHDVEWLRQLCQDVISELEHDFRC